jgi:hypothetical protein
MPYLQPRETANAHDRRSRQHFVRPFVRSCPPRAIDIAASLICYERMMTLPKKLSVSNQSV